MANNNQKSRQKYHQTKSAADNRPPKNNPTRMTPHDRAILRHLPENI
jgi:hypothetical protein